MENMILIYKNTDIHWYGQRGPAMSATVLFIHGNFTQLPIFWQWCIDDQKRLQAALLKVTTVTPLYPNTMTHSPSKISHRTKPCLKKTKQQSKHTSKMQSAGEDTNLGAAGEKTLFGERQGSKREKRQKERGVIKKHNHCFFFFFESSGSAMSFSWWMMGRGTIIIAQQPPPG